MDAKRISNQISVKHCSLCPGTVEYYCHDCKGDLCKECKETHVDVLDIKYHNVTVYRGKFRLSVRREVCTEHLGQAIKRYCEPCELPVCSLCTKHRKHKLQNIKTVNKNKRMQLNNIFIHISCETLYNAQFVLTVIKSDYTKCHKETDQLKNDMLIMSKRLKDSLDNVQREIRMKYKDFLVCRILRQKKKMQRIIAGIQKYEHKYDLSADRPVQFLQLIKEISLPQTQDNPHLSQHCLLSLSQKYNMDDLIKLLSEINITESGKKRRADKCSDLILMSSPVLQKSLIMTGVHGCFHISLIKSDRVWVSDNENLFLIDTATGATLYSLKNLLGPHTGQHTVNSDMQLIYIDKHCNINKLSSDMKTTTLLIDFRDPALTPLCVYCSPSSGDLLVGMLVYDKYTQTDTDPPIGKVIRYDRTGTPTQTIPRDNSTVNLYSVPRYITENNNGDVVVSDNVALAVVVTSAEGNHRFSYTGLYPQGICTDALSHILVCDRASHKVHMLSQDGEFLKFLLTYPSSRVDDYPPWSLSYDPYTHCLFLGLGQVPWLGNTLFVYRHINRQPSIQDRS